MCSKENVENLLSKYDTIYTDAEANKGPFKRNFEKALYFIFSFGT